MKLTLKRSAAQPNFAPITLGLVDRLADTARGIDEKLTEDTKNLPAQAKS